MIFGKPLDQVTKADIEDLKNRDILEGLLLDYKETLRAKMRDDEKHELLADITSFANTSGGVIVFGIKDRREGNSALGRPDKIVGVKKDDIGPAMHSLEQLVRDCTEPRVIGFRPYEIDIGPKADPVLLLHIPRSFNPPHAVRFGGSGYRFYVRTNTGKRQLDVAEIRSTFVASEGWSERARQFRTDRLARILSGEMPVILNSYPKRVLHVVLLRAFDRASQMSVDPASLLRNSPPVIVPHLDGAPNNSRPNLDGVVYFHDPNRLTTRAVTSSFSGTAASRPLSRGVCSPIKDSCASRAWASRMRS